jgi:hypothetical protein
MLLAQIQNIYQEVNLNVQKSVILSERNEKLIEKFRLLR